MSRWKEVQALVLRPAHADAVAHLVLRVAPERGGEALKQLELLLQEAPLTLGDETPARDLHCTLGFSYRGLEALGMPPQYLRVFSRLAPAFKQGAPLRAARMGDSGTSAPEGWLPGFALDQAHVLLTLHGAKVDVDKRVATWALRQGQGSALVRVALLEGERLGAPPGESGQWVHFGYRDGLVDHHIEGVQRSLAPLHAKGHAERVAHAAGEFLLGHPNDDDFNPFALPRAPSEVREFFHDSSFGVLRPMRQEVHQFAQAVRTWRDEARQVLAGASDQWVKAKLCGRWPSGEAIRPGQSQPVPGDMRLDFENDKEGTGCPWSSHVRRMDARGHENALQRQRILLRRGMPYGPAKWPGQDTDPVDAKDDGKERGLLGLFFCASLEDQFEQLLGQWAHGAPPGGPPGSLASDPFAAQNGDASAAALVPMTGAAPPLALRGFQSWTRTLGTVFTWHPDGAAVGRILREDYLPAEEGPWL